MGVLYHQMQAVYREFFSVFNYTLLANRESKSWGYGLRAGTTSPESGEADGHGVGDVVGFGELVELEFDLDRALDLLLGCAAGAGEGFLDGLGGEFDGVDADGLEAEHDHAAGVGHDDGWARVGVVAEEGLDRRGGGAGALEEVGQVGVELDEALADGGLGREAEAAGLDDGDGSRGPIGFEAGVAGDFEAGIDGEEAHGERLAGIGGLRIGGGLVEGRAFGKSDFAVLLR